jgi:hypothetical protein
MRITLACLVVVAAARVAGADPVVLAVDGQDVYVDLGAKDGVGEGSELQLLHEVIAKDPRTGATLRDHFALGTLRVVKAGDAVCVARTSAELAKRVLAGDQIRLASAKRSFVDPWAEQVAASKTAPPPPPGNPSAPAVDHVALARQAWQDTLGKSPEQRIDRWHALVSQDPQTPYRKAIATEITSLQAQLAARDAAVAKARSTTTSDRSPRVAELAELVFGPERRELVVITAPIEHAAPHRPIELAFLARAPATIGRAWLYVRPDGDPGFRRVALVRDGDAYLRGQIDGELVHGSGLDWYVEVGGRDEAVDMQPVLGSQRAPNRIEIDDVVDEAPIASGRSHVDLHVDYVDFDGRLDKGFDQYYQAEADFQYRFLDPIYSVRLGFGSLSGIGGDKDIIDHDRTINDACLDPMGRYECKRMTFSYVYTELEYRFRPNVAVMVRPQAGLLSTDTMAGASPTRCSGQDIIGCSFSTGWGGHVRLRLGEERGTNLVLGAGFTRGVGTLLEAGYHWLPTAIVPVKVTVQVTDQPVVENFGVRLIGDVGLRRLSWFYPSLRVSYQARDIDHAGFSGGFAMNFDW